MFFLSLCVRFDVIWPHREKECVSSLTSQRGTKIVVAAQGQEARIHHPLELMTLPSGNARGLGSGWQYASCVCCVDDASERGLPAVGARVRATRLLPFPIPAAASLCFDFCTVH